MDYFGKLTEAFNFTWRYKKLWVLGFLIALFGGGGGNWGSTNYSGFSDNFSREDRINFSEGVNNNISGAEVLLILGVSFVVLIILIIGWYLMSRAKAGLVLSVKDDANGDEPTLGRAWGQGGKYVWRYILMDVLVIAINILIVVPLLLLSAAFSLLGSFFAVVSFLLLCLLVPIGLLYLAFWAMIYTSAQRVIVLEDLGAWAALKRGFYLARTKLGDFILGFLVFVLPTCAWQLVSCVILIIPMLLMFVVFVAAIATESVVVIAAVGVPLFIIFILITALVNAPFSTFGYTYWTKLVMEMTGSAHKTKITVAKE